jgi:hypothetical protein
VFTWNDFVVELDLNYIDIDSGWVKRYHIVPGLDLLHGVLDQAVVYGNFELTLARRARVYRKLALLVHLCLDQLAHNNATRIVDFNQKRAALERYPGIVQIKMMSA